MLVIRFRNAWRDDFDVTSDSAHSSDSSRQVAHGGFRACVEGAAVEGDHAEVRSDVDHGPVANRDLVFECTARVVGVMYLSPRRLLKCSVSGWSQCPGQQLVHVERFA